MRHAVSSASRDSREENVRGAKLTEKRTRGSPCRAYAISSASRGSREKTSGAPNSEKDERGVMQSLCSFKCKQGLQGRKRQGRQIDGEEDERGVMQSLCSFKCKQGLQGRKRQGRQIDGEKGREGRHAEPMQFQVQAGAPGKKRQVRQIQKRTRGASCRVYAVSSASRGSREENVRGAKLTEKRTRGSPCSFKCKQGLQGRKRQGRQIDGKKDERCAIQFQVQAWAPGKKTSGSPCRAYAISSASRGSMEKTSGAPNSEKDERGVMQSLCSFKCKQGLQGRKRQGRQIDGEEDERGVMQSLCSFKCKQGLQGRKRQGRQIDGEKDERGVMQFQVQAKEQEGRHAVSSASRGSREENVRGAKLTEKRTRDVPYSFKCKHGLQGRKLQGREIDGEKDVRGAMQFQVQAGAPRKKTSGAPN